MLKNNIFKTVFLLCFMFMITGCVKFNADIEIKKNKSMTFDVIYAYDSSVFGDDQSIITDEEKQKLQTSGFLVDNYKDGNMSGIKLSKSIKSIDDISSDSAVEYDLSGLTSEKASTPMFSVKKGFLKNTYTAKFKFSTSSESDDESTDIITDYDYETTDSSIDISSDINTSSLTNMDLALNVKLPYSAISNNATNSEDGNKRLSWDLSKLSSTDTIEFQFELYNMRNIYILIGIGIFLIFSLISNNIKKDATKEQDNIKVEVPKKETYETQIPVPNNTVTTGNTKPEPPKSSQVGIEAFMNMQPNASNNIPKNENKEAFNSNMDVNELMEAQMKGINPQSIPNTSASLEDLMNIEPNQPVLNETTQSPPLMTPQGGIPEVSLDELENLQVPPQSNMPNVSDNQQNNLNQ